METNDLTKGSIFKQQMKLAIPLVAASVITMAYNLIDMFWVGKLGTSELSAVSLAGQYFWFSIALIEFARVGTEIKIATNVGAQNQDKIRSYARNGMRIGIIISLAYSIITLIFAGKMIDVYNITNVQTHELAVMYLRTLSIGIFFNMFSMIFVAFFQGLGRTHELAKVLGLGLGLNIVLDPIFIFVFDLGVIGAAIATTISILIIFIIFVIKVARESNVFKDFKLFQYDKHEIKEILRISAPSATQTVSFNIIAIVMSIIIVSFGDVAVVANRVASQIEGLTWMVGIGISSSMSTFTAQNYGARNYGRIKESFKVMMTSMTLYGIGISLLFVLIPGQIISIFTPDPEVIAMGTTYFRIVAISQVAMFFEGISAGVFNGISKTKIPASIQITGNVLRVPLAMLLSSMIGVNGIWLAICLTTLFKGITLLSILLYNMFVKKIFDAPTGAQA